LLRVLGALLQRNISLTELLQFWSGDERGNHFENNHEDFPFCIPISTQALHAAGIAYAIKLRQQKRAVVSTCGDGGTSKGDFYEAMNFAGVHQLPIVFVANNNQWAISVPRQSQTEAKTIAQKAIAAGFNGIQVDGFDVIAVREAVAQALKNARAGKGPTLIEAITYRLCDHTTADDATRYQPKKETDQAWQLEPIKRLKRYLETQKIWTEKDEQALQKKLH